MIVLKYNINGAKFARIYDDVDESAAAIRKSVLEANGIPVKMIKKQPK